MGENMSARADFKSAFRRGLTPVGGRASFVALVLAALIVPSSHAFALKIPIQAYLSGGGEVLANTSTAKGLMERTFDTDTNTLTWTVTYSGLSSLPIGAHFHGPVSYLVLTPEENAPIQVGTPGNLASPFHGVAKIDDTQAKDLKDGRWYFNLHSKNFLAGEIRGPVVRR
jgi:CHRD domain